VVFEQFVARIREAFIDKDAGSATAEFRGCGNGSSFRRMAFDVDIRHREIPQMMRWLGSLIVVIAANSLASAAEFDLYTNKVLRDAIDDKKFTEIKELTPDMIVENDSVLSDINGAFIAMRTNDGRYAKLIVRRARVKVKEDQVPLILLAQFVTFKDGTDRAVYASGQNVHLYTDFRFQLDFGQVVPTNIGGDLQVTAAADDPYSLTLKPVGKAQMYLIAKPLPDLAPKKAPKLVVGENFEIRYFAGKYKLYDDGRRAGELELAVDDKGEVSGFYTSDRDGEKYELFGKVGTPKHAVSFTVKLPRTEQTFSGYLFTGNGKILAGSSKMQGREAGFYAERIEE